MEFKYQQHPFNSDLRASQSLCNDRCQNILYNAVFEHFIEIRDIAAVLLASKSFQNSSFGANFIVNFVVDENTISLLESVLSPSSCFSLQFAPSLHIKQSWSNSPKIDRSIFNFVGELENTKYFHLSLRSLTLENATNDVLSCFFGSSTTNSWPQLQDFTLRNCGLNDAVMESISKNAPHIRTANLYESTSITEVGIEHLSQLSNITLLNLSWCNTIKDDSLELISNLSGITSLNLCACNAITDAGLEHLVKLSNITSFNLSYCGLITDVGLKHVSKLSEITSLNLYDCDKITDTGIEYISALTSITFLDLYNCRLVTDAGFVHVAKLSRITSLHLRFCDQITDAGLENLSQLSRITSLDLFCCGKITDAGLEHITAHFSNITSLNLFCCNDITDAAKTKFRVAMPNCSIVE